MRRIFHKVRLKPGKPIWFGVGPIQTRGRRDGADPGTLARVRAPGQPGERAGGLLAVRSAGLGDPVQSACPGPYPARLARPFRHRGDRPTYFPAPVIRASSRVRNCREIETLDWSGSADLRTAAAADGFAAFAAGDHDYAAGDMVDFLPSWSFHP